MKFYKVLALGVLVAALVGIPLSVYRPRTDTAAAKKLEVALLPAGVSTPKEPPKREIELKAFWQTFVDIGPNPKIPFENVHFSTPRTLLYKGRQVRYLYGKSNLGNRYVRVVGYQVSLPYEVDGEKRVKVVSTDEGDDEAITSLLRKQGLKGQINFW